MAGAVANGRSTFGAWKTKRVSCILSNMKHFIFWLLTARMCPHLTPQSSAQNNWIWEPHSMIFTKHPRMWEQKKYSQKSGHDDNDENGDNQNSFCWSCWQHMARLSNHFYTMFPFFTAHHSTIKTIFPPHSFPIWWNMFLSEQLKKVGPEGLRLI